MHFLPQMCSVAGLVGSRRQASNKSGVKMVICLDHECVVGLSIQCHVIERLSEIILDALQAHDVCSLSRLRRLFVSAQAR